MQIHQRNMTPLWRKESGLGSGATAGPTGMLKEQSEEIDQTYKLQ